APALRSLPLRWLAVLPGLLAALLLLAWRRAGALTPPRMIDVDGNLAPEDPGRASLAVRSRAPAPRPRSRLRRPVGRVRALPPAAGQRRSHGERNGRARHAGDGGGGQGREVVR